MTTEAISSPSEDAELAHRGESDPECHFSECGQDLPFQEAMASTGAELKEKRLAAGLKQAQVAAALGTPEAVLSYVERGHVTRSFVADYLQAVELLSGGGPSE